MRSEMRTAALALLVLAFPSGAAALTTEEAVCRDATAKWVTRYVTGVSKLLIRCHQRRSFGDQSLGDDCNDPEVADIDFELPALREMTREGFVTECAGAESLLLSVYTQCPPSFTEVDDLGLTTGIDDFAELADCFMAIGDEHSSALSWDVEGLPSSVLLKPLRTCQLKLGRGATHITQIYLNERRRCQKLADFAGGGLEFSCDATDDRGRIARTRSRFQARIADSCNLPDIALLNACAPDYEGMLACSLASADEHGATMVAEAYFLSSELVPTTTTTTTTLAPVDCGPSSIAPTCAGACPDGQVCAETAGICLCVIVP